MHYYQESLRKEQLKRGVQRTHCKGIEMVTVRGSRRKDGMWPFPPSWGSCCLQRTILLVECEASESGGDSLCLARPFVGNSERA